MKCPAVVPQGLLIAEQIMAPFMVGALVLSYWSWDMTYISPILFLVFLLTLSIATPVEVLTPEPPVAMAWSSSAMLRDTSYVFISCQSRLGTALDRPSAVLPALF